MNRITKILLISGLVLASLYGAMRLVAYQYVQPDAVLREMWIDKWDGALPTYITGQQSSMMLGVPKQ